MLTGWPVGVPAVLLPREKSKNTALLPPETDVILGGVIGVFPGHRHVPVLLSSGK